MLSWAHCHKVSGRSRQFLETVATLIRSALRPHVTRSLSLSALLTFGGHGTELEEKMWVSSLMVSTCTRSAARHRSQHGLNDLELHLGEEGGATTLGEALHDGGL